MGTDSRSMATPEELLSFIVEITREFPKLSTEKQVHAKLVERGGAFASVSQTKVKKALKAIAQMSAAKEEAAGSSKSDASASSSASLLTPEGDLTEAFKTTLQTIFKRFDADADGVLCEAELKAYSVAANPDGREFEEDELEEIRDYFEWAKGTGAQEGL